MFRAGRVRKIRTQQQGALHRAIVGVTQGTRGLMAGRVYPVRRLSLKVARAQPLVINVHQIQCRQVPALNLSRVSAMLVTRALMEQDVLRVLQTRSKIQLVQKASAQQHALSVPKIPLRRKPALQIQHAFVMLGIPGRMVDRARNVQQARSKARQALSHA